MKITSRRAVIVASIAVLGVGGATTAAFAATSGRGTATTPAPSTQTAPTQTAPTQTPPAYGGGNMAHGCPGMGGSSGSGGGSSSSSGT